MFLIDYSKFINRFKKDYKNKILLDPITAHRKLEKLEEAENIKVEVILSASKATAETDLEWGELDTSPSLSWTGSTSSAAGTVTQHALRCQLLEHQPKAKANSRLPFDIIEDYFFS